MERLTVTFAFLLLIIIGLASRYKHSGYFDTRVIVTMAVLISLVIYLIYKFNKYKTLQGMVFGTKIKNELLNFSNGNSSLTLYKVDDAHNSGSIVIDVSYIKSAHIKLSDAQVKLLINALTEEYKNIEVNRLS